MSGKQRKFEEGRSQTAFFYSKDQDDEIEQSCQKIMVTGSRGKPRPMNKAEFFREGARHLARSLRDGTYKPLPDHRRTDEAEVVSTRRKRRVNREVTASP